MSKLRIAVLGSPGKWSTETMAQEIRQRTGWCQVIDINEIALHLPSGKVRAGRLVLDELDAIVVRKINARHPAYIPSLLELLRVVEAQGVRIFSPVNALRGLINRLSCTTSLQLAGIPLPPTTVTANVDEALLAMACYQSAILKPLFSSKARGMQLLEMREGNTRLRQRLEAHLQRHPAIYLQQRLDLPGRDLALVFIGDHYMGTYARVAAPGSWNTTIREGGRYAAYQPSDELIELGRRAQAVFNLDYTTVDIAETDQGPRVFEVSALGGFKGSQEGIGINIATLYADYVIRHVEAAKP